MRKSPGKVRIYPRATEGLSYYRIVPRDGGERSAFYAWVKTPEDGEKAQRKAMLEAKACQLLDSHRRTYGYWRLSKELDKAGIKSGITKCDI